MAAPLDALEDLDTYLGEVSAADEGDGKVSGLCSECGVSPAPLVSATNSGHTGCLSKMLAAQASQGLHLSAIRCENDATLSHLAARRGDRETLKLLLAADPALSTIGDVRGATPLHVSAYHGYADCVVYLLENGSQANHGDQDGATAVHFAAASGHIGCLKELVKRGDGDPNAQTNTGETPVYFAAQEGHLDCVRWLIERAGADPRLASSDGMTPLHAAAQTGRLHVTHWLVRSANCPLTLQTCDGATPVHFAAAKGHVTILEWLLHHSLASGLEQDDFGATPVHDAAEQGQLDCLSVFYSHSVDLNHRDCDNLTPRDLAEERGHTQCVSFLDNPEQFMEKRRTYAKSKHAELGLLVGHKHTEMSSSKKKKRTFSFLAKKKGNDYSQ